MSNTSAQLTIHLSKATPSFVSLCGERRPKILPWKVTSASPLRVRVGATLYTTRATEVDHMSHGDRELALCDKCLKEATKLAVSAPENAS